MRYNLQRMEFQPIHSASCYESVVDMCGPGVCVMKDCRLDREIIVVSYLKSRLSIEIGCGDEAVSPCQARSAKNKNGVTWQVSSGYNLLEQN